MSCNSHSCNRAAHVRGIWREIVNIYIYISIYVYIYFKIYIYRWSRGGCMYWRFRGRKCEESGDEGVMEGPRWGCAHCAYRRILESFCFVLFLLLLLFFFFFFADKFLFFGSGSESSRKFGSGLFGEDEYLSGVRKCVLYSLLS